MSDIFDVVDLSDIKHNIGVGVNKKHENIAELLRLAKRPLTIDELTVGYYRKYGKSFLTKRQMTLMVYQLARRNAYGIQSVGRGVYKLKDSE